MKLKTFFVPIYGFKVEIHDNSNVIMANKRIKAATLVDPDKMLILMGFNFDEAWGTPTVAHECLHAVNGILNARGVIADFTNDEAQCYLLEWFMERVVEILQEAEKKYRNTKEKKND